MTPPTTEPAIPLVFSNHAIDRLIQRFPELASEDELRAAVGRAEAVCWHQLRAEANHCGRPLRVTRLNVLFRDERTGCLFITRLPDDGKQVLVCVTVVRFRRPEGFQWLG